jgi:hypothetical protein
MKIALNVISRFRNNIVLGLTVLLVSTTCLAEDIPLGETSDWKWILADSPVGMLVKMRDGTIHAVVKAVGKNTETGQLDIHPVVVDCDNNRIQFGSKSKWETPSAGSVKGVTLQTVCKRGRALR